MLPPCPGLWHREGPNWPRPAGCPGGCRLRRLSTAAPVHEQPASRRRRSRGCSMAGSARQPTGTRAVVQSAKGGAQCRTTNRVIHSIRRSCSGTPVFVGTRVPLQTLLDYIESGQPLGEFLEDFPTAPNTRRLPRWSKPKRLSSPVRVLLDECLPRRSNTRPDWALTRALLRRWGGQGRETEICCGWPLHSSTSSSPFTASTTEPGDIDRRWRLIVPDPFGNGTGQAGSAVHLHERHACHAAFTRGDTPFVAAAREGARSRRLSDADEKQETAQPLVFFTYSSVRNLKSCVRRDEI